jgi:hypothetical protein
MPKFIVERNIPGADKLTANDLCDIAAKSNAVVDGSIVSTKQTVPRRYTGTQKSAVSPLT